ncbi:MAG: septum formation initiator family protein [Paludibacteraceae bacterium]|nr:septum formation initiator family protein [Paludibacteraceae bacterium]
MIDWSQIWMVIRKYVLNKYILTLLIFAAIFIFVGEQSLMKDMQRNRKVRQTERAIQETKQAIDKAQHQINVLNRTDSLERYGREHYLMHKDNEDIYLVEE